MDAIPYDQNFITRPLTDDICYGNNDCCNIIPDYRAVEEANVLLNAASLPTLDTGFTMFNGAELPVFHGTFLAPNAENAHSDYRSDIDGSGSNCANHGGASGSVKEGRDVVYAEAVLNQEPVALGPLCMQNKRQLICGNVNDFSMRYSLNQNILECTTGESCYNRGCFNPYENKQPALMSTENVISTLLREEKTSMEPLELDRPGSMNNDKKDDLASEKVTEVHSDGQQSPQEYRKGLLINNTITARKGILVNQENDKQLTQKIVVKDDGGRNSLGKFLSNSEGRAGDATKSKGQPAKNLLAERRRRKRLKDRLCMLRSVVPTISKMDRTSILSATIEYIKQLLNHIKCFHKDVEPQIMWPAHLRAYGGYFDSVSDQYLADKTSPELEVRRTEGWHLNIQMACHTNPNLLLSTVSTLQSFGLEIQEGVFTTFRDFGMQAQCSETEKGKRNTKPEDIKVALLQKAACFGRSE